MHRVPTIALAYFAACACAAVVMGLAFAVHEGSLTALVPSAVLALIAGSVVAFPFALPVILWSETIRTLGFWSFAGAGFAVGALVLLSIALVINPRPGAAQEFLILGAHILPSTTLAAIAYWWVAWRVDPPMEAP